ncbi:MAG: putative WhiB family transcriptional regulator [Ilumatobacteraceae bacterium]|nr:putative WhiB family transcriptional regulator [Ilumatobacteraceae bacterium]
MAALEITTEFELSDGEHWKDYAVCSGRISLFFPPRAERPQARARRERHARRLCATCPVQQHCQQYARSNHEYGFWGGESEEARHLAGYTVSAPIGIRVARRTPA